MPWAGYEPALKDLYPRVCNNPMALLALVLTKGHYEVTFHLRGQFCKTIAKERAFLFSRIKYFLIMAKRKKGQ